MLLNLVYFINLLLALILPCCPDDWIQSNQTHYRRLSLWEKKTYKMMYNVHTAADKDYELTNCVDLSR